MTLSRRGFLEAGALSASGFLFQEIASPFHLPAQEASQPPDPTLAAYPALKARQEFNFDQGWHFYRPAEGSKQEDVTTGTGTSLPPLTEARWEDATLPHTVRLEPRDVSGGQNYQGICWYRKQFKLQPAWNTSILYLTFQGAMQVADVWLNGMHLTTHYGGYLPFTLNISSAAYLTAQIL